MEYSEEFWPELPFKQWQNTCETLHMWTQIIGKIRLKQTPWINHSWHVPLYLTSRGLTTSPIPYGFRTFEIDFDFIDHLLLIKTGEGAVKNIKLQPQSVADFYKEVFKILNDLGLEIKINQKPNEVEDPRIFSENYHLKSYDPEAAWRFWQVLKNTDRVFKSFKANFIGKCSPVHFFWGSFDLAYTRFSGKPAPEHPGGIPNLPDWVVREAYSHEVSSCGFWPGSSASPTPVFYAYAYPEPEGYKKAIIKPEIAYYSQDLHEFILPYTDMIKTPSPDATLYEFLQSTYEAAANSAKWDRTALEKKLPF
jgi:hypothetical protein